MFRKGGMRESGIDITLNNPDHVLSPDDYGKVLDARFGKISKKEYREWYMGLIRERLRTRGKEIRDLALRGLGEDIVFRCYCPLSSPYCHGKMAADFMNAAAEKIKTSSNRKGVKDGA